MRWGYQENFERGYMADALSEASNGKHGRTSMESLLSKPRKKEEATIGPNGEANGTTLASHGTCMLAHDGL